MRVLQVIHGYPPHYMAGSEVYTRSFVRELSAHATVAVFTRVENLFAAPYTVDDSVEGGVRVVRVNKPGRDYTFEDKFVDPRMDDLFRSFVRDFKPDVVHIGHLGHLSTNIVSIARREFEIPVVVTLHDFWLKCFRGQLVTTEGAICSGPSTDGCLKCARASYKHTVDATCVERNQEHMRAILDDVDLFLAPSRTVLDFFRAQGVPPNRLVYSPYGFARPAPREPRPVGPDRVLRFGFLGRVIPVKGVDVLIRAFRGVRGSVRLDVHGDVGGQRGFLAALAGEDSRIQFLGAYDNDDVHRILAALDAVVVPSLWLENAPLVIQEAKLAGVPVLTSDLGGMAELVRQGVDGFRFPAGDVGALTNLIQSLADAPQQLATLDVDGSSVRDIRDDVADCIARYRELCSPRRLTIVTNPGLCNMACTMCDTHSVHAPDGYAKGRPILPWSVVEATLRDLARLGLREVIPSTMGEPLLYPEFDRLLELTSELDLALNLTTNGSFPRGGVSAWAPKLLPVLSDIKVSLNAIDPEVNERIMVGANTDRQRRNVEEFLAARDQYWNRTGRRPTVTIQVTFMEQNLGALAELLRWAVRAGVDRFKGHHLWVTWEVMESESLRRSPEAAARWNAVAAELVQIADIERGPGGRKTRLENVVPLDLTAPAGPPADTECPFLGREAWLEADGSFQVCCCPAEKRRAFGDFGNIAERPLARIWASRSYREFTRSWGEHPNCSTCNMRRPRSGPRDV